MEYGKAKIPARFSIDKIMSIKNLTITMVCDQCGAQAVYEPMNDASEFDDWFESLAFDLCPECKLSDAGIERIIHARRVREKISSALAGKSAG